MYREVFLPVDNSQHSDWAADRAIELAKKFEGRVTSIAPIATEPEEARAERTVLVSTELNNTPLLLKPEMTGHAKIYCGQQRLIDIVMRRLIRFLRVEFWSWW